MDERVTFGRPDWRSISERGLCCADMHFHTCYSDSFTKIGDAIALAKKRGVGFAITDHNLVAGAMEACSEKRDVMVIPGIEISSWDGPHILAYFYDAGSLKEYWEKNIRKYVPKSPWLAIEKDTEWILNSLEGENCLVSAAHPLGYFFFNKGVQKCINKGYLDESIVERLDAYEVICSGMSRSENEAALEAASRYGLGYTGGTDGHLLSEVGNVVAVSDAKDVDGFLNNIKNGRNTIIGKEKAPQKKVLMGTASAARFMPYLLPSIAEHYKQNIGKGSAYRKKS